MKIEIQKVSLDSLKRDFRYYPRQAVSGETVSRFVDAMQAGAIFPPLRVCEKTGRIIDGFHRYGAYSQLRVESVNVVCETVADESDFFVRAVEANKAHGFGYSYSDYQKIISIGTSLGLEREKISLIASIPIQKIADLTRNIPSHDPALTMPLKGHERREHAPHEQSKNQPLQPRPDAVTFSGFMFSCNQVIRYMRSDLCDMGNETVFSKIRELEACITKHLNPARMQDLVCVKIRDGAATFADLSIELGLPLSEVKEIVKQLVDDGRVIQGKRGGKGEVQRGDMTELLHLVDNKITRIPDDRSAHPAIVAFKAATGSFPKRILMDSVIEKIGEAPDVSRLNQVFVAWTAKGYNPMNLNWLDWYINGVPQNGNGKGQTNGKSYETASSRNVRRIGESLSYLSELPTDNR